MRVRGARRGGRAIARAAADAAANHGGATAGIKYYVKQSLLKRWAQLTMSCVFSNSPTFIDGPICDIESCGHIYNCKIMSTKTIR